MSSASLIKPPAEKVRVNTAVFYTSALLILLLTALLIAVPDAAGRLLGIAQSWLTVEVTKGPAVRFEAIEFVLVDRACRTDGRHADGTSIM